MISMSESFSQTARKVMQSAQDEALRLRLRYIDTEHLLWAFLREEQCSAAKLLTIRYQLSYVQQIVEPKMKQRQEGVLQRDIGFTSRAKKVLELAVEEMHRAQAEKVTTALILVAILREGGGMAAEVLVDLGFDLEHLRSEAAEFSRENG